MIVETRCIQYTPGMRLRRLFLTAARHSGLVSVPRPTCALAGLVAVHAVLELIGPQMGALEETDPSILGMSPVIDHAAQARSAR